uniref:Uncharacterized protein n=1 Tax=Rhizophora mucronata TaxID=61149 RepID=A0A2P2JA57_RHIMU
MVNVSSLCTSSSTPSFQMEPPSNQSYYGMYKSRWEEEEKMVGMKRSYPFSVDNSPAPSLLHKKLPPIAHPIGRSDDQSCSVGTGGALNLISGNTNSREEPSCSGSIMESHSRKAIEENGVLNGDFLTLAPPTINLTCPSSKLNRPSAYLAFSNHDTIDFSSLPSQGNMEYPIHQSAPSVPNPRQPCYSFLPTTIMQTGQATKTFDSSNGGEVGENLDLNLKL